MKKICEDLVGKRFGKLLVIQRAKNYVTPKGQNHSCWLCECDCGNRKIIRSAYLKNGTTTSCGCFHKNQLSKRMKKYNTYDLSNDYGIGYTENGEKFYFDLDDYEKIKEYCWHVTGYKDKTTNTKYISSFDKNNRTLYMHRFVMNVCDEDYKIQIDHINHNKQDNRKKNLRIVTNSENQFNIPLRKNNTSGYIGVGFNKSKNIWYATIRLNGKTKYLGSSKSKEVAVKLRQDAENKYYYTTIYGGNTI